MYIDERNGSAEMLLSIF